MEKYSENESMLFNIDRKIENRPEFKKMLNNLLGIANRDNAVFMSSKISNFDLKTLLDERDFNKVLNNESFTVEIKNVQDNIVIRDLELTDNFDDFIDITDLNGIPISITNRILLEKDFLNHKENLIANIKKKKNKRIAKWKKIKNRYLDKQVQINSWPLYIGTMFLKVKTYRSTLYAPLILKKAKINITSTNKVQIKSMDDSVQINEKLLFLLKNEYKFELPKLKEEAKFSLKEATQIFLNSLKNIIEKDFDFFDKFEFFQKNDIKNQDLQYAPGVVLSIISPSGGRLRDKLIELIENEQIDEILDVDITEDWNEIIIKDIKNDNFIYRINQTDFSQEKAIIGSLKDHAIIWGPPGTGKSQVISNIVANLLYRNNKTIITSEKKAALDVIQERMGKLAKFMFFGLTNKNVDKKLFYKPFKELISIIQKSRIINWKKPQNFITLAEQKMFKQREKLVNENILNLVNTWNIINKKHPDIDLYKLVQRFGQIINLEKKLLNKLDPKETFEETILKLGFKKEGFIWKRYPKNIRLIKKLLSFCNNDVELVKRISKINNLDNLNQKNLLLETEKDFQLNSYDFENDEDFLEMSLALRFREKIKKLKQDEFTRKKIKSFLRSANSAWRIPYKFVDIYKEIITNLFDTFVSTPQTLAGIINMNLEYDYAIFDEASQMHLEKAIPFISIAKKSVIAGDNQQMKPTSWIEIRDNSIDFEETEFDADSLLNFAYRNGLEAREYMLTKNYRSKSSELMMFSSKEFYKSKLDVIDNKNFIDKESIKVYDVDGKWEGRTNHLEAKLALDKLIELAKNYNKIILLTLNSSQKQYIESLIYNTKIYFPIIEMLESGKVFLRNLENIQGDEADLVIVSVAYDKSARFASTYVARPEGRNALNVAISRAKEMIIIFKSIKSSEIYSKNKNDSIITLKKWLEYLELETIDRKKYVLRSHKKNEQFDSNFEEEVYDYLVKNLKLNFKAYVKTQFLIGSYKIDIAIIDENNNEFMLGIEVDGYKYHSGFEKNLKDLERQRFIEAKGYKIYRITELNWKTSKAKELNKIHNCISY